MKTWEGELTLETGHSADLSPVLTVGPVSETVVVTETIALVTTRSPCRAGDTPSQNTRCRGGY